MNFLFVAFLFFFSVAAAHLLPDNEYVFLGSQLTESEVTQLVAVMRARYKSNLVNEKYHTFFSRVEKLVRDNLATTRITRDLLPGAFERLASEYDAAVELKNQNLQQQQQQRQQQNPELPTFKELATFRKLLSVDEDEIDEDDLDSEDFVDEGTASESSYSSEYSITDYGNNIKAITRGGNGNHKHCESGREVVQLSTDKMPDLSTLHPEFSLYVNEEEGSLRFTVEVPYIPFDARYIISFDPIEHAAETPLSCSSDYEGKNSSSALKSKNLWGHAPNANYRDAFTSKKDFAAYYASPESKWIPQASGCSHVKYGATFSIEELTNCADSVGKFAIGLTDVPNNANAIAMFGVVWISLLQPSTYSQTTHNDTLKNAIVVAKWAHQFSITLDQHDSKIILTDSANGGIRSKINHKPTIARESLGAKQRPRSVTILRRASITKDGFLELNLQTQFDASSSHHCRAKNLTLAHIGWTEFELAEAPIHGETGAYCFNVKNPSDGKESSVMLQNWRVRSKLALQVYDGDFVLLFCYLNPETDEQCDESNAVHRTTLGVRMSNSEASLEKTEEISFHNEITQHVSLSQSVENEVDAEANEGAEMSSRVHTGQYESGQRACMQSYVVGPKKITSHVELKLIEAWLCTIDDSTMSKENAEKSICTAGSHFVRLAWTEENSTTMFVNDALHVAVYHPGAYGLLSVGVCFDVNARFVDSNNRSVIEKNQRYEAKVKMQPATMRRTGPMHVASMFSFVQRLVADKNREYDPAIESLCAHAIDQSLQSAPFVMSKLRKSLDKARESGLDVSVKAHEFSVQPSEDDDSILSDFDNAIALVITFLAMFLFAVLLYMCFVGSSRLQIFASRQSI